MSNIEKADKIVGLDAIDAARVATGNCQKIVEWARRGAYLAWLTENQSTAPSACEGITSMADRIVHIDASRKPKFPSDGLPLGPWRVMSYMSCVHDAANNTVCQPLSNSHTNYGSNRTIQDYIARCGSLSVRRIMAACDDAALAKWADAIEFNEHVDKKAVRR